MQLELSQYDLVRAALAPSANGNYTPGMSPKAVAQVRFPCPVHGGSDALTRRQGDDGRALLTCFDCDAGFGTIMDALGVEHGNPGVTLDTLADYFGVPVEWLEDEGWQDDSYTTRGEDKHEVKRVRIPYADPSTGDIISRFRTGLTGKGVCGRSDVVARMGCWTVFAARAL